MPDPTARMKHPARHSVTGDRPIELRPLATLDGQSAWQRLSRIVKEYPVVRRSGRFDRAYYVSQLRRVGFRRYLPLLHYLWSGERKGRRPFPDFSPLAYLSQHEEIIDRHISPLYDFVLRGEGAGPAPSGDDVGLEKLLPGIVPRRPASPLAIHCHIFYFHLFDEIYELLDRLDARADLYFTVADKEGAAPILAKIAARWPDATALRFPNRGRDIYPFLYLVNAGAFDGYALVGKIHTKKSIHRRDGDLWRRHLMTDILKADGRIGKIAARFAAEPDLGVVVADGQHLTGGEFWGGNAARVAELSARIGIRAEDYPLSFPAGSMYWLCPALVARLKEMHLGFDDFEPESGQVDDTTAHAVERAMGILAAAMGLRILEVREVLGE